MNATKLEIANYIASRGSKALLEIEALVIKAKNMEENKEHSPAFKAGFYSAIIDQIYNKVIEGTESKFVAKK